MYLLRLFGNRWWHLQTDWLSAAIYPNICLAHKMRGNSLSGLRAGSPLSHARDRRKGKRSGGEESGGEVYFLASRLRRSISRALVLQREPGYCIYKILELARILNLHVCNKIVWFHNGCDKVDIELCVVHFWSEIMRFQTTQSYAAASFNLEIVRMISDQMTLNSVQLPLYITHTIEIFKYLTVPWKHWWISSSILDELIVSNRLLIIYLVCYFITYFSEIC